MVAGGSGNAPGAGDGRGPAVAPLLRRAERAVRLARLAECLLLAVTVHLLVLSAAVVSGGDLARPQAWGAAALCALLTAATWWLEKRPVAGRVAARVDRHLGLGGGLVTAFEAETGPAEARSPLARLLSSRLLRRLSGRRVLSAALPLSLPFAALPFLAAGVLSLTLEGRRPAVAAPWLGEISGPLVVELGRAHGLIAGGELAGISPRAALHAERLAREALAAGASLNRALAGGEEDPARLSIPTRTLQERMAELAQSLPPGGEAQAAADRARAMTDAVALALGLDAVPAPVAPAMAVPALARSDGGPPGDGGEGVPAPGAGAGAALPGSVASEDGPEGDRALSSEDDTAAAVAPAAPEAAAAGRWWPEHLDGLVRRWASDDRTSDDPAGVRPNRGRGVGDGQERR